MRNGTTPVWVVFTCCLDPQAPGWGEYRWRPLLRTDNVDVARVEARLLRYDGFNAAVRWFRSEADALAETAADNARFAAKAGVDPTYPTR